MKGQKWRQTFSAHGTTMQADPPVAFDPNFTLQQGFRQTLVLRNEVMFANPNYTIVRATFERYDQTSTFSAAGKADPDRTPDRSKFTRAFIGAPFKIKRATNGRILAVSGLKTLIARGRKSIAVLATSPAERDRLLDFLPDPDTLRLIITNCYSPVLPPTSLSPGESYPYDFYILPTYLIARVVPIKRTLRSVDQSTARYDDQLTFNTFGEKPEIRAEDRFYNALTGTLSGHTTVDVTTGWSRTELAYMLKGKVTQNIKANRHRTTWSARENTQFTFLCEAI